MKLHKFNKNQYGVLFSWKELYILSKVVGANCDIADQYIKTRGMWAELESQDVRDVIADTLGEFFDLCEKECDHRMDDVILVRMKEGE